jgi:hypothetical protein
MNVNVLTGRDEDSVDLDAEFHGRKRVKIEPNLPEGGKRQRVGFHLNVVLGLGFLKKLLAHHIGFSCPGLYAG